MPIWHPLLCSAVIKVQFRLDLSIRTDLCQYYPFVLCLTTHSPAVTDVFGSGRNVGAFRPGRHVGFR